MLKYRSLLKQLNPTVSRSLSTTKSWDSLRRALVTLADQLAPQISSAMRVIPVPCRTDNYMYLLIDDSTSPAAVAVVDPYDYTKLSAAAKEANVTIGQTLLTTHHHNDHSGGNADFVQNFPKADVYAGSDKAPGANKLLRNGDKFKVGDIEVTALHTPCHTQDHICYFVEDKKTNERGVFTGDTLFVGGNGRFFEGTPAEMLRAMNVLSELPGDTKTFVGHEYTKSNVAFAMSVDPTNEAIKKLHDFANKNEVTTGVFTIGDEKEWNVFMRVNSAAVREATGSSDQVTAMGKLRELKARLWYLARARRDSECED